ncbi:hypothetical protein A3F58_04160 [Candidatus Roizmanbacteria bacterium RIFCSPHIGHO2_12_FULL_37_9b]|uniref:Transposase IS200-like domain-containing protein n=1 Tax=Candidatus Roizmanbacteria bacterium RIFCSPHIGHO2_02_FULL_38_11 TaxID=1802039 RepID=A0A1F7H220_9BACT|nr:MAG: hypothetical protein A3C25_02395 [Candidatus Roizmanbacteria bacterium RIFCSPHIGHO2_02_FULL_38_11]OGK34724.1 MAG: hypothetical protein A3F58_04160 [Candidatus Roizmanbacteria bacterium RIFCSPHIGHO2_12_FULL_37_9b]
MEGRKSYFKENSFWHLCNKSIANFGIFKDPINSQRFVEILDYYNNINSKIRYSYAIRKKIYKYQNILIPKNESIVKILSFCIMPDHYHLVIKILVDNILSKYINDIENSFTHFFNRKFDRKGPLWQTSFRSVLVKTNEQLLHVTRYVNINPTASNLVDKPEDWSFSSYKDIISQPVFLKDYLTEISITKPESYKKFAEDNIDYQRRLKMIKKLILE